ncbi:MAG: DOMON domain-containing protein [Candidatus Kariarchaeaceae archaeon]|jgi:hypothetical protein
MRRKYIIYWVFGLLFVSPITQVLGSPTSTDIQTDSIIIDQVDTSIPFVDTSNVIIDGNVTDNEYQAEYYVPIIQSPESPSDGILVYWEFNDDNLTVALISSGTGWVSLAIGTSMFDANMIMGGLDGLNAYCNDTISKGLVIPPDDTTQVGGSNDILAYNATESATNTTLEFVIPLDSGDSNDKLLVANNSYTMFFAYHETIDDITIKHSGFSNKFEVYLGDEDDDPGSIDVGEFDFSVPAVEISNVIIDGDITEDEFPGSFYDRDSGMTVHWEHTLENITFGIIAPSTGWVSLGIGSLMYESNMIMGGVDSSGTYCLDLVGLTNWNHTEDINEGGTDDILACDATESNEETTLEFIIPFNSSDQLDPVLEQGKVYSMFLAYGPTDDITQIHDAHSNIIDVFLRPPAITIETTLSIESLPEEVHDGEEFEMSVILTDTNGSLANVSIEFFMVTAFGLHSIGKVDTDINGRANISYSNKYLDGNYTFGAKSNEVIEIQGSDVFAYSISEVEKGIMFHPYEVEDEFAEYQDISRFGILAAFWVMGIVIWGGFIHSMWGVVEIYLERNVAAKENQNQNSPSENIEGDDTT